MHGTRVPHGRVENGGIEKQRQPEPRILDAYLDGYRTPVGARQAHERRSSEARTESAGIVDENQDEYEDDVADKELPVRDEHAQHHSDEHYDGEHRESLLNLLRKLGEEMGAEDTQHDRDAQDDKHRHEDIPEGDYQLGNGERARKSGKAQIEIAPQQEVEGRDERGKHSRQRCHAHRQFHVSLRMRANEIRDVTSRAACHENHSQRYHRRQERAQQHDEKERYERQPDPLEHDARKHRLGMRENALQHVDTYA